MKVVRLPCLMTEVFSKVKSLTKEWRKVPDREDQPKVQKCGVLEDRPSISCIATELAHLHAWRPVEMMTTAPELFGQKDNDRLIIESVKQLKRERGLHHGVFLLTGDKDMASLASLENVNTLFVGNPPLPASVSSIRYDSANGTLRMSAIHALLWNLTQVFSVIRFRSLEEGANRQLELRYYCDARESFFMNDVLELTGE